MYITYTTTLEFDSDLAYVRTALANPQIWVALLPGLEQHGACWRYAGRLYDLRFTQDGDTLCWSVVSVGDSCRSLMLQVVLHTALISTHADLTIICASLNSPLALFAHRALRKQIANLCHAAGVHARALLAAPRHADLPHDLAHPLADRYPRSVAAFAEMGALEHLERIARLDQVWRDMRMTTAGQANSLTDGVYLQSSGPLPPAQANFDLIYAGGGLGLIHAAVMARRYGYRVLLFDRGMVGCAHREWNISREELDALVATGLCSWEDLRAVMMSEYERGVVRFYAGPGKAPVELWMRHVLDVALDANALLQLARRALEAAGGVVLDQRIFERVLVGAEHPLQARVQVRRPDGVQECYAAHLLLDAMGSISPLALRRFKGQPFAGVCPTVGTVVEGLVTGQAPDEHNPRIGDILLSVADAQRGQQYMWEGFPGRGDELTVYLFYYDTLLAGGVAPERPTPPDLMQLFEDYFALLPTYKRPGPHFRHIKPVYGYIPARHSVRRQEAALLPGVLPVGDSAAQQSPLTFCGFGSHVRNLDRTTLLLHEALQNGLTSPRDLRLISPYQVNVSLNWVFSRFMQPWGRPDDVNALQNIFLGVLNDLGEDLARRFFRDQMRWSDYHHMLLGLLRRHPRILITVWHVLGAGRVWQWMGDYLTYSAAALLALAGRRLSDSQRRRLAHMFGRVSPALRLWLLARFAEWRAMGWG